MSKIKYIEFVNGHKEEDVSQDKAAEKIEKAMDKGDYVVIEKEDGKNVSSNDIAEEAKKESKGDKKKEKTIRKEKIKKNTKDAKTVKQVKPVSGG